MYAVSRKNNDETSLYGITGNIILRGDIPLLRHTSN